MYVEGGGEEVLRVFYVLKILVFSRKRQINEPRDVNSTITSCRTARIHPVTHVNDQNIQIGNSRGSTSGSGNERGIVHEREEVNTRRMGRGGLWVVVKQQQI